MSRAPISSTNQTKVTNGTHSESDNSEQPKTGRGRALHTVDSFLNGRVNSRDYDSEDLRIESLKLNAKR